MLVPSLHHLSAAAVKHSPTTEQAHSRVGELKLIDLGLCRSIRGVTPKSDVQPPASTDATNKPPGQMEAVDEDVGLARQLTAHVVTRWYRAPELLFPNAQSGSSLQYGFAVDLWSVGCIVAEWLLEARVIPPTNTNTMTAALSARQRAQPLFSAAQSALPLSPRARVGKSTKTGLRRVGNRHRSFQ